MQLKDMKLRRLAMLVVFLAVSCSALVAADGAKPVRWRMIVKRTGETTATVTFRALVAQGWHLYGLELPENGPRPTTFNLKYTDCTPGKMMPARQASEVEDPLFGMKLAWWDANVDFTLPLTITGPAPAIDGYVEFMTCDGNTCMPPAKEYFNAKVREYNK